AQVAVEVRAVEAADEPELAVAGGEVLRVAVGVLQGRQELQGQLQRAAVAAVALQVGGLARHAARLGQALGVRRRRHVGEGAGRCAWLRIRPYRAAPGAVLSAPTLGGAEMSPTP